MDIRILEKDMLADHPMRTGKRVYLLTEKTMRFQSQFEMPTAKFNAFSSIGEIK